MARPRTAAVSEIVFTAVGGLLFLAVGGFGFAQIVRGEVTIFAHFCNRYAFHVTSTAGFLAAVGLILGLALIWRAIDLSRERASNRDYGRPHRHG